MTELSKQLRQIKNHLDDGAEFIGAYLIIDGEFLLIDRYSRSTKIKPPGNLSAANLTNPALIDKALYTIKDGRNRWHTAQYEAEENGGFGRFSLMSGQFFCAEDIADWMLCIDAGTEL